MPVGCVLPRTGRDLPQTKQKLGLLPSGRAAQRFQSLEGLEKCLHACIGVRATFNSYLLCKSGADMWHGTACMMVDVPVSA